ncbi:hypothetical protein C8J55DRAFT_486023 [Lentinula edodes]|uniref:Uncharacterized protein n=1 Tax=Lentinula lateritia TaxID=40482 RepID=A0A9W9AYQ5_9AGAR|nr:hypothetical protein C8J55DRAFT_486023 [Lentinula edodes]
MLLLPQSCARSHFVLVLFLSTILGTFAIPLAPRESPSTIPELKPRTNNLEVSLGLKRTDSDGKTLPYKVEKNPKDLDYPGVVLLLPDENWFIIFARTQEISAKKNPTTNLWEIQRTAVSRPRLRQIMGIAEFGNTEDKLKFFDAIDHLPSQPSPYGALHMVIEYISGRMKMKEYPLPVTFKYEDQENNWQQIFWAMTNPTRENQYPHTPYLKLAPGMTLDGWRKLNDPMKNGGNTATWPFVGTFSEDVPHVQQEAVPSKGKHIQFLPGNASPWDKSQEPISHIQESFYHGIPSCGMHHKYNQRMLRVTQIENLPPGDLAIDEYADLVKHHKIPVTTFIKAIPFA